VLSLIAVPIFFLLSGNLLLNPMNYKYEPPVIFYKKRLTKVFIPFLLWSLFYIYNTTGVTGVLQGLKTISLYPAAGHLWYIYPLLGYYLITPWLRDCFKRVDENQNRIVIYLWGIFIVLGSTFDMILPENNINHYSGESTVVIRSHIFGPLSTVFPLFGNIGFFLYGAYIEKDSKKVPFSLITIFYFIGSCLTFLVGYYSQTIDNVLAWWNYTTLGIVIQSIAVYMLFAKFKLTVKGKLKKWIIKVSNLTLHAYFIHYYLIEQLIKYFPNLFAKNFLISLIFISVMIFITSIICSYILTQLSLLFKVLFGRLKSSSEKK
jgi:surface polysaccharide O-acyltransferase-like enzyme